MTFRFTTILLAAGLLLSSCQKELAFKDSNFEARLVVNSVFSPDSLWSICISNTKDVLDDSSVIENIEGAQILLEDRSTNIDIPVIEVGEGMYISDGVVPIEGHRYEIFIEKNGYKTARSFTYVPKNVNPEIVTIEEVNTFDEEVYKISIEIEDDPSEQNYYIWELVSEEKNNAGVVINSDNVQELKDYLKEGFPKDQPKFGTLTALSSDGIFSGEIYNEDFFIVPNNAVTDGSGSSGGTQTNTQLFLKVRSVSQDLYRYHESLKRYKNSANVNTSISSPISIFSNIENGLGMFGSYNESIIVIKL